MVVLAFPLRRYSAQLICLDCIIRFASFLMCSQISSLCFCEESQFLGIVFSNGKIGILKTNAVLFFTWRRWVDFYFYTQDYHLHHVQNYPLLLKINDAFCATFNSRHQLLCVGCIRFFDLEWYHCPCFSSLCLSMLLQFTFRCQNIAGW